MAGFCTGRIGSDGRRRRAAKTAGGTRSFRLPASAFRSRHDRRTMDDSSEKRFVKVAAENQFLVVGVGASAGGLEAFERLFRPMATDTGMAFVLMTHLARQHASALPEIVGRYTKMPVRSARDRIEVEPNHVYTCPPGRVMILEKGRLRLRPGVAADSKPIDVFLTSLAKDCGASSI